MIRNWSSTAKKSLLPLLLPSYLDPRHSPKKSDRAPHFSRHRSRPLVAPIWHRKLCCCGRWRWFQRRDSELTLYTAGDFQTASGSRIGHLTANIRITTDVALTAAHRYNSSSRYFTALYHCRFFQRLDRALVFSSSFKKSESLLKAVTGNDWAKH